ncbi:MAG: DUF1592 domain-containing protein [Myxococcota bacterium]
MPWWRSHWLAAWVLGVGLAALGGCEGSVEASDGSPPLAESRRPRPPGVPLPGDASCRPPPERLWQLTPLQLASLRQSAFANELDGEDTLASLPSALERYQVTGEPFTNDPSTLNASRLLMTELNRRDRAMLEPLALCDGGCDAAIGRFGSAILRRPLTAEESAVLNDGFARDRTAFGDQRATHIALRRLLLHPAALFRSELGVLDEATGVLSLSDHEIADFIAFTILDAPPDAELRAKADEGALHDEAGRSQQVMRLAAEVPDRERWVQGSSDSPRPLVRGLGRFFREWLDLDEIQLAPGDPRVLRWFENEAMLLIHSVLYEEDARLETLLTADYTFYSHTLAEFYGYPRDENAEGRPRRETTDGRRGILMGGGWLAAHDGATARGKFIRERLFCQDVVLPEEDVDMNLPGLEAELEREQRTNLSPREVRARHMSDPSCAACHRQLDPLGFPFDGFGEMGEARGEWDGFPIDTAGEIVGTAASDGSVADAQELVAHLANSSDVRRCFVEQMYRYVHGRAWAESDRCYLDWLEARFEETGGNVLDLFGQMLLGPEARLRTPIWAEENR